MLFAVLAASVFLAVGATIVSSTIKNLIFSTSGRESQFAFYAADSGAECALYFDKVQEIFPTVLNTDLPAPFTCHNQLVGDLETAADSGDPRVQTTTFTIKGYNAAGTVVDLSAPCASVTVTKLYDPASEEFRTQVTSHGYNTCDETSVRRIERLLRVQY